MDFIKIPFGYLLDWLYQFSGNYGLALILFSLIVKLVLLPMSIKSKKSTLKMARIAPLAKALEQKYADDKAKYQQELMALYKEEGVSPTGGCLWSFVPLLLLFPLYAVIREPITYLMHVPAETTAQIMEFFTSEGIVAEGSYFAQLVAAGNLTEHLPALQAQFPEVVGQLKNINFSFLGLDLSAVPAWKFWTLTGWAEIGLFLLPIISGASNMVSSWLAQKLNSAVSTNDKGEKDAAAAKASGTMGMMMWMMPLLSVYIGFTLPAAVTIYWIAQAAFSLIIDNVMTVVLRKKYDAEDAERRAKAAAQKLLEEEKERQRAERRAANPEGITANTSKKKQERKEREEHEAAAKKYAAEQAGVDPEAEAETDREKCPSGIPERPYCKGRNYDPDRYKK